MNLNTIVHCSVPLLISFVLTEIGIELFHTLGTDPVAEICVRMFMDIRFDLVPVASVIPDLLTGGTDGEETA